MRASFQLSNSAAGCNYNAGQMTSTSHHRVLRHRHSYRDLLTSPDAAPTTTSTASFPATVSFDHQPSASRRPTHQPPHLRGTLVKRSSWPRVFHPPSSIELCSGGGVVAVGMTPDSRPMQAQGASAASRSRRSRHQPPASLDSTTSSYHYQLTDADYACPTAIDAIVDWRRTPYGDRRSNALSASGAGDTLSMCSVDAVSFVSGPEVRSSTSTTNACRPAAGGCPVQSVDTMAGGRFPGGAVVDIGSADGGGNGGNGGAPTSGVDCQTVMRCLDSCDKILLRHSTTITWCSDDHWFFSTHSTHVG